MGESEKNTSDLVWINSNAWIKQDFPGYPVVLLCW